MRSYRPASYDRREHKSTRDATISDGDPSDSSSNHGNIVMRMFSRLGHSLIPSLLRRSYVPASSHNVEKSPEQELSTAPGETKSIEEKKPDTQTATSKVQDALATRKLAEQFYTVDTDTYSFKSVLEAFSKEGSRIMPKSMKFIIGRRALQRCASSEDPAISGPDSVTECCINPLLDKVVQEFCRMLGLTQVSRLPSCPERIFLWYCRESAQRLLVDMGGSDSGGNQMYFVNRVNLDNVLTDLQCLCTRLGACVARDGQVYPAHCCADPDKIRELSRPIPGQPPPRSVFMGRQTLCQHVYLKQDFGMACSVKGCPNFGKALCACFQMDMFIPDTIVLATRRKFENFRSNILNRVYGDQRWIIRSSIQKNGNGVQMLDTVPELETFMRFDLTKKMRGQFFVLQRYLKNPLLLDGKRFDLRMFLLVVVLTDRRVIGFLHPGYLRQAQMKFDPDSNDLRCHLTYPFTWDPDYNRYKKRPGDAKLQETQQQQQQQQQQQPQQQQQQQQQETQSQPQQEEKSTSGNNGQQSDDYCRLYSEACESLGLPKITCTRDLDAVLRTHTRADGASANGGAENTSNRFLQRLSRIVHYLVSQVDSIVCEKPGSWQLFGLDLQLDTDKELWLMDVESYPSPGEPDPRSQAQNRVVPAVLTEALALVFELNQRDLATRSSALWLDLPDVPVNQPGLILAQKNFVWMYSTEVDRLITFKPQRQRTKSPHWYRRWRVTEDFNDYILYLKQHRNTNFPLVDDTTLYGRQSFEHSPAEKFRVLLKAAAKLAAASAKAAAANDNSPTNDFADSQAKSTDAADGDVEPMV